MPIPKFNRRGVLDKGIYPCTTEEFIEKFCYGDNTVRSKYKELLKQLFAFSASREVSSIIIGGSFVTNKKEPNDLDCIVILPNEKCLTMQTDELLSMDGCTLDVMFVVEKNKESVYSLINLFSLDRFDLSVGMVEVTLIGEKDKSTWDDYLDYNSLQKLFDARECYINRKVLRGISTKKVLITLCNVKEYFFWNYKIAPMVSASNWIFAPYVYKSDFKNDYELFIKWLLYIHCTYNTEICIFADGIGSYIIGQYVNDNREYCHVPLDKIILSRTLLTSGFNWDTGIKSNNINLVINLVDKSGKCKIHETISKDITRMEIFGEAYKKGFMLNNEKVINYDYKYSDSISSIEFQSSIMPLFNISDMLEENNNNELRENLAEIMSQDSTSKDIII